MAKDFWTRLLFDIWLLSLESSAVIASRTMKLAAGGKAAETETRRMVAEKIDAALSLQKLAVTGGLGTTPQSAAQTTLRYYNRRVRANRRRLGKR
jgi:hypothetical protein